MRCRGGEGAGQERADDEEDELLTWQDEKERVEDVKQATLGGWEEERTKTEVSRNQEEEQRLKKSRALWINK